MQQRSLTGMAEAVGNTPLVPLRRVVPAGSGQVLLKLESQNPTGSMKDRMALAVVAGAEARAQLQPDGMLVEYTGGSSGTSLAIQRMMERARELAQQPGAFYADQFNNPDAADGYASLAQELWAQTGGSLDAFVQSVGTAQCITGVARGLRARHPRVQVIAVEPSESAVLSGGAPGSHKIEGVGPGFVAPIWRPEVADAIQTVSTADAMAMARRLAREEAIFAGTSTGANVVAALQVAARLGPQATVVTLACDSGLKYLSTPLFSAR